MARLWLLILCDCHLFLYPHLVVNGSCNQLLIKRIFLKTSRQNFNLGQFSCTDLVLSPHGIDDIIAYRWFSTSTAVTAGQQNFLVQNVAIKAFFSGKIEKFGNLTGVKDLTNSTSTAVAAAGQQTLLSHDLDRAGAGQPRCPGRIQPHTKRTILSTI